MKKYKLIKKYPGSPELGTIIINNEKVDSAHTLDKRRYINGCLIQCYPEYWEEVVEKDYEILSLIHFKDTCRILKDKGNIKAWEYGNAQHLWKIHSIKRLSDGEIFTIGDKVIHTNNVKNKLGIILNFHILSNGIWFKTNNYDVPMCYIYNKVKKPLLTTKDGVDIFENDIYYTVNFTRNYPCEKIDIGVMRKNFIKNMSYKYFSTKEAAKKYIEWNQPKYSLKDVEKAFEHYQYRYNETIIRNLKNNMK